MTHGGTDAIIASVTSSDDYDILAFGIDIMTILQLRVKERLRV